MANERSYRRGYNQFQEFQSLLGCRSGKFGPQKDGESVKFGGKCGMN